MVLPIASWRSHVAGVTANTANSMHGCRVCLNIYLTSSCNTLYHEKSLYICMRKARKEKENNANMINNKSREAQKALG